jgi:hypothetical protein
VFPVPLVKDNVKVLLYGEVQICTITLLHTTCKINDRVVQKSHFSRVPIDSNKVVSAIHRYGYFLATTIQYCMFLSDMFLLIITVCQKYVSLKPILEAVYIHNISCYKTMKLFPLETVFPQELYWGSGYGRGLYTGKYPPRGGDIS